jgi:WD40 repeat protein
VLTLKGHTGAVASVSFNPDGTSLATGGFDGTARIWDTRSDAERLTTVRHPSP